MSNYNSNMNNGGSRNARRDELLGLAEAVINDCATGDQVKQLEQLLEGSEEARGWYLEFTSIHAGLKKRFMSPENDKAETHSNLPSAPNSDSQGAPGQPGWRGSAMQLTGLLALAASLALGIAFFPSSRDATDQASVVEEQLASLGGVAVLAKSVGVEWSSEADHFAEGSPLPAGPIAIDSGVMQVEFYSGAVAVIEGPAELHLVSPLEGFLVSGKLRARVPSRAKGFMVRTRDGNVVDLGTEFAIDLSQSGEPGELHVIDGEVRFHPVLSEGESAHHVLGGQAMTMGPEPADIELSTASGDRFIGMAEVETLARREAEQRLADWLVYRERLKADPSVLAFYAHSPEPAWSRMLRNEAMDAAPDSHGSVVGCTWTEGRWPGHKALRFRNASHAVAVNLPGEHDSLTLSTWISVDRFHPVNQVALLHPDTAQKRNIHWTLDRVEQGAVLHFSDTVLVGGNHVRRHYSSGVQGMFNYDLDRWVLLSAVYDGDLGRVSHYRNGQLVGWQPIGSKRKLSIGVANIGNWPYKSWAEGTKFETRNLIGRLDEFVVFNRAVTGAELEEMYRVGAP